MIKIPMALQKKYHALLVENAIPREIHGYYEKWLRYYLDFCRKYHSSYSNPESLLVFLRKLSEKKQNKDQQSQAREAVQLYYSGISLETQLIGPRDQVNEPEKSYKTVKRKSPWEATLNALHNEIKLRHYSPKTDQSYSLWAQKLRYFTHEKPPQELTPAIVKEFLTSLAVEKKVSASSQNQAFNALLFFFRHVLNKEFGKIDGVVRAKRKAYIPVVLSRQEIDKILGRLSEPYRLIVQLLYGCGLRLSECLNLRLNNFNFDFGILTIHDGKGKKDRTVPLPGSIELELKAQIEKIVVVHRNDLEAGYAGTFMPGALEKKYQNAGKELYWQWFFPAKKLTFVPENNEYRRFHLHETHVQKAIRQSVQKAALLKRVSAHTFRHSFASHLLQANYDIRTIQELLGHSDVRTTMVYTHTIKSRTLKETKSPLDI